MGRVRLSNKEGVIWPPLNAYAPVYRPIIVLDVKEVIMVGASHVSVTSLGLKLKGGGAGSILACEDLERMFDHSFLACAFLSSFFFFFKWKLARAR